MTSDSPSVLVTGAGGFVGSSMAAGFTQLGWRVTAVDRSFDDTTRARLVGAIVVTADLAAGAPEDLPIAQYVIHGAAITTDPRELGWTKAEHVAANMRPLVAMLDYVARARPKAFVFLSSSGVFAPGDGADTLKDSDTPTSRTPYAVAKRAGELLTLQSLDADTTPYVVRLGYVYGPHETTRESRTRVSMVSEWLTAARSGLPLELRADDPARDWTFAPDLAPAIARLMQSSSGGRVVHLASRHIVKDSAMAARIMRMFPGATSVTRPAAFPAKPPMRACDVPGLRAFTWTDPSTALEQLTAAEARR